MNLISSVRNQAFAARLQYLSLRGRIAGEYRRIYHYHVRKTGGTSLNSAVLSAFGLDFSSLERCKRVRRGGLAFVQHNRPLIKKGKFFFASSHAAAHALRVPAETFTVTVLRNPVDRVVSHYRYLLSVRTDAQARERERPFMKALEREMRWLGESFADFLDRMPREHLLRQLFMFSANYDIQEATERILTCSAVCFTETFNEDLRVLSRRLEIPLKVRHERRSVTRLPLPERDMRLARELLESEFTMLERVRKGLGIVYHY